MLIRTVHTEFHCGDCSASIPLNPAAPLLESAGRGALQRAARLSQSHDFDFNDTMTTMSARSTSRNVLKTPTRVKDSGLRTRHVSFFWHAGELAGRPNGTTIAGLLRD